ncbi:hypothetical protein P9112_001268 [Eukaryota sp. TZLM1-RC]
MRLLVFFTLLAALALACDDTGSSVNSIPCSLCEWVVGNVQSKISEDTTKEQIISLVGTACKYVPSSISTKCGELIEEYGPALIDLLVDRFPPHVVCSSIGLCHEEFVEYDDNSIQCSICTWVIGNIEAKITDETTEEEIIQFVEQVCNVVPHSMQDVCHNMIQEYGHMIIEMLVDRFPPEVICASIGLCKDQAFEYENSTKCSACTFVIGLIEGKIDDQSSREQIREVVLQICDKVPSLMRSVCRDMISGYVDDIVDMLLQKYPAHKVCEKIHLCKAKMEILPDNDFGCSTCVFIIGALEAKLDDDATREEIREALMHVCKNVGSLLRPMCEEIMETYSDSIVDLLLAKYPAQKICEEIKLCKKKMEILPDNDFGCSTCVFIIGALEAKLDDDATREEIREALMHVCKNVGSLLRPMCEEIMETYSDSIVDLLLAKYPAQKICEEIKLCKKKMEILPDNDFGCSTCVFIIGALEAKLDDDATREEIREALMHVCKNVGSLLRPMCEEIMETYSDSIVDLFIGQVPRTKDL